MNITQCEIADGECGREAVSLYEYVDGARVVERRHVCGDDACQHVAAKGHGAKVIVVALATVRGLARSHAKGSSAPKGPSAWEADAEHYGRQPGFAYQAALYAAVAREQRALGLW